MSTVGEVFICWGESARVHAREGYSRQTASKIAMPINQEEPIINVQA